MSALSDKVVAFGDCAQRAEGGLDYRQPSLVALHKLPKRLRRHVQLCDGRPLGKERDALSILPDAPDLLWTRTHEIIGSGRDRFLMRAARSVRLLDVPRDVIFIGRSRDITTLRPEGLAAFCPTGSTTLIQADRRSDILWASEQALCAKAGALVITQIDSGPTLSESRRLQIAAETGGSLGLISISGTPRSSACQTRWRCEAGADKTGAAKTGANGHEWTLLKNKSGELGSWWVGLESISLESADL